MNVVITPVDQDQVRESLRAFRTRKHKDAEREYADVVARLELLQDVTGLLDVQDAITSAGLGADQRPRLALARADRLVVQVDTSPGTRSIRFDASDSRRLQSLPQFVEHFTFNFPDGTRWMRGFARVPLVPPAIRDATKGPLKDFHILWEVDAWMDTDPLRVDRDPILLKRVNGMLFGVIAEWDLTPLEMAILNSIRPARR